MIDMSNAEEVIKKLEELKSRNMAYMTIKVLSDINKSFAGMIENATDEEKETIEEYLKKYLDDTQIDGSKCIFTETCPSLDWGLAHGVLIDKNSGLSWRRYHYFIIDGKECKLEKTMQYHPSVYELN